MDRSRLFITAMCSLSPRLSVSYLRRCCCLEAVVAPREWCYYGIEEVEAEDEIAAEIEERVASRFISIM